MFVPDIEIRVRTVAGLMVADWNSTKAGDESTKADDECMNAGGGSTNAGGSSTKTGDSSTKAGDGSHECGRWVHESGRWVHECGWQVYESGKQFYECGGQLHESRRWLVRKQYRTASGSDRVPPLDLYPKRLSAALTRLPRRVTRPALKGWYAARRKGEGA